VFPALEVNLGHLEPGLLSVAHNEHLKKDTQYYFLRGSNSGKQPRLIEIIKVILI
jgi:hypothetical protein